VLAILVVFHSESKLFAVVFVFLLGLKTNIFNVE